VQVLEAHKTQRPNMTFDNKLKFFQEKIALLVLIILVLEFSLPHKLLAIELTNDNSNSLGPVALKLSDTNPDNDMDIPFFTKEPRLVRYITITAYSSTIDQCDDTPFITANGKTVYDGLVAANFLKFGTQVKIPEYFGEKVFTVNDRMNVKHSDRIDVWMPTREQAVQFGARYLKVEIY